MVHFDSPWKPQTVFHSITETHHHETLCRSEFIASLNLQFPCYILLHIDTLFFLIKGLKECSWEWTAAAISLQFLQELLCLDIHHTGQQH